MKKLLILLEIIILGFFLFWHLRLGLVRFFDADEFAHLHWGYSFFIGERPYTDFFYLFPPFFLYPVAMILKIFGRSVQALIAARMFIFLVFLAVSGVLFLIAKKLRGAHFALVALIIFAFLPLPFDKMIEVRPDMLATGLALAGLLLFIKAEDKTNKADKTNMESKWYFFSGLSYATSLAVVPKTVFFLVPAAVVMIVGYLSNLGHLGRKKKDWSYFFLGFIPVGLILLAIVASFGNLSLSFYSMTRMASEVTKVLGSKFYMRPDIFFYPNETYYGFAGWSIELWTNLIIYISAGVWAIHKFISSLSHDDDKKCLKEFLIAGTFWANLAAFVYFYPLKHAQYLIPVAPFIAFYFADLWEEGVNKLPKSLKVLKMGMMIILLVFLAGVGRQMNQKKAAWTNKPTLDKLNFFLKTIPPTEAVFDLTGESIFFKNGYYFCCLPYGQYEEALYFSIPDIKKEMQKRGTKYVHLGWEKRLNEIPARHAGYITENFAPMPDSGLLWKKK